LAARTIQEDPLKFSLLIFLGNLIIFSPTQYENWLQGTAFAGLENATLSVAVPDRETRAWMEREYTQLIRDGIRDLVLPIRAIGYQVELPRGPRNQALAALDEVTPEPGITSTNLNPNSCYAEGWSAPAISSHTRRQDGRHLTSAV
jgi:chromosomal replication initiation ATPase DnaA